MDFPWRTLFKEENMKTKHAFVFAVIIVGLAFVAGPAFAADKKPNILVMIADQMIAKRPGDSRGLGLKDFVQLNSKK
jgi:hypothetical protein